MEWLMNTIQVLATGQVSDFVFNEVMAKAFAIVNNNFMLFWILAQLWVKFSKFTDNTLDDKLSGMLVAWLEKFRPEGGRENENEEIRADAKPVHDPAYAYDFRVGAGLHSETPESGGENRVHNVQDPEDRKDIPRGGVVGSGGVLQTGAD